MKNDIDLMVEIANMYFIERKTEQEIADILFFSRSKISRLIKKAIDTGIVNISINYPTTRLKDVEMKLKLRFGVTDAIVIQTKEQNDSLNELCKLAGTYIDELISDDMTIGVSWGKTIYKIARNLSPKRPKNINVVQITGVTGESRYDASNIIRTIAKKFHGEFKALPLPLYLDDTLTMNAFKNNILVKEVLELGRRCEIVLTGVGSFDMTSNSVWQSTITDKQKAEYIAQGARATFLAHIIDRDGNLVGQEYDSHLVTMSMQEIQNVPNVVCVASGAKKSKALLAVLKSGLIKTLIIDDVLAKTILEME